MIDVQVFGTSCAACVALEKNVGAAVAELGEGYRVEKVGQLLEMVRLGVTQLPALAMIASTAGHRPLDTTSQ